MRRTPSMTKHNSPDFVFHRVETAKKSCLSPHGDWRKDPGDPGGFSMNNYETHIVVKLMKNWIWILVGICNSLILQKFRKLQTSQSCHFSCARQQAPCTGICKMLHLAIRAFLSRYKGEKDLWNMQRVFVKKPRIRTCRERFSELSANSNILHLLMSSPRLPGTLVDGLAKLPSKLLNFWVILIVEHMFTTHNQPQIMLQVMVRNTKACWI